MHALARPSRFAAGALATAALLLLCGEAFLRCFPPADFRPYLGEASASSGPFRPDERLGLRYRDWDAFAGDYAARLRLLAAASESPRCWAMFGNSFVQMDGMLADTARAELPDRPVFNLARNEPPAVRAAQVGLLLDHGMRPERVFFVLLPHDSLGFAKHSLDQVRVTPAGGIAYEPRRPAALAGMLDNSRLAMLAWIRTGRHEAVPGFRPASINDRTHPSVLADMRRLFDHLGECGRRSQTPITVVLIPNHEQITRGAGFAFQDAMIPECRDAGLDVCDVRQVFLSADDRPGLFIPDKHFSARGNRLLLWAILGHLSHADSPQVTRGAAMNFDSQSFALMATVVYALWLVVRRHERAAVALLLTASLLFYGSGDWKLLPLLLLYCVLDWAVALWLEITHRPRLVLALGVGFNLGVLCFFKYTPMILVTFVGYPTEQLAKWPLPFGISFYAFTGVAYMVDVYRRTCPAERNLGRYTLSAVFFPHLVAGPILRADEFLNDLRPGAMPTEAKSLLRATWLIVRGYAKKRVLAERVALLIEPFFAHVNDGSTAGVWALPYVYLYALQILLDFSAYTDIARGIGLLFGYRWPDNFDWPYLASSVAEFWKRWHITLSRFLRDYLYIPLGGSRGGMVRTCVNLMLTMLLGGLWHGASWSFLLWGGLHGMFLVIHRLWRETPVATWMERRGGFAWRGLSILLTFHCVCLAWCFFRLTHLSDSVACVRKRFAFDADKVLSPALLDPSLPILLAAYVLASLAVNLLERFSGEFAAGCRWGLRAGVLALAVLLAPGGTAAQFIYFQF